MNGRVLNVKEPLGKLLVFGGVYSNYQSLCALREIADSEGIPPNNVFNTGDSVAYCAQPEECVQLLIDWKINSIAGNVEIQIREDRDDCGCNFNEDGTCDLNSKNWFPFAKSRLSLSAVEWMRQLPEFIKFKYGGHKFFMLHGSYDYTSEFIYKSTDSEIKMRNFHQTNADVILAGHCGLPFSEHLSDKLWINPGVIGMPANDGTSRVWYMIIEVTEDEVRYEHMYFEYDFKRTANLILENGLPSVYAKTLSTGLWDNCEILPEMETGKQGKFLIL